MEDVDLCKGYRNPQSKMGVALHFFKIIGVESQQKCCDAQNICVLAKVGTVLN